MQGRLHGLGLGQQAVVGMSTTLQPCHSLKLASVHPTCTSTDVGHGVRRCS